MDAISWDNLPSEFVSIIAHKLDCLETLLKFSAVCKSWNSFVAELNISLPPKDPWLLLAEGSELDLTSVLVTELERIPCTADKNYNDHNDNYVDDDHQDDDDRDTNDDNQIVQVNRIIMGAGDLFKNVSSVCGFYGLVKQKVHYLDLPEAAGRIILGERDMSVLQFKQKMSPQPQLLLWINWFSHWKFEAKHVKGKNNFFSNYLSKTQRTICSVFPLTYSVQTEDLPAHIKDNILYFVLQKRSLANLLAFQKIYIRQYGLTEGPLANLPLCPAYPFSTILVLNGRFKFYFPKEAYMFLWYFVETCPFGVIFEKADLLQCLGVANIRPCKRKYKQLYKWLNLFGNSMFWHENLTPKGNNINEVREQRYILVQFNCQRNISIDAEGQGLSIRREYSCTFYHDAIYNSNRPTDQHKALMCEVNNIPFSEIPRGLPIDYVADIQKYHLKLSLESVTTDLDDPNHPDFRLHKRTPFRFYKRLPGLKYRVLVSSGSEEDEDVES